MDNNTATVLVMTGFFLTLTFIVWVASRIGK